MPSPRSMHRAFTLVEMLTVMVIVGLMVAILLPALNMARESSRATVCRNNLRELGVGMQGFANKNNGLLCTGAFDWVADGSVTEVGWVADLVKQNMPVGEMRCPSNTAQFSETFKDLLNAVPAGGCINMLGGPDTSSSSGVAVQNPCKQLAGLPPLSAQRMEIIDNLLLAKYFNTNYTASWFLVRSAVKLKSDGNLDCDMACLASQQNIKGRACTLGPLHLARLDGGTKPSNFVPLLGCGTSAEKLNQPLGESNDPHLVKSVTGGPVKKDTLQAPVFASGHPRENKNGVSGWWETWNDLTLQDYRAFGPVHSGGVCNLLFADGSVRGYADESGDSYLNNGFPANSTTGFTSTDIEIPETTVSSKWSLRP